MTSIYINCILGHVAKLVYCTRTIPEIEKVIEELRKLYKHYEQEVGPEFQVQKSKITNRQTQSFSMAASFILQMVGLSLSSRRNLCIHPEASKERDGKLVDSKCHSLIARHIRDRHVKAPGSVPVCDFFEVRKQMPDDEN